MTARVSFLTLLTVAVAIPAAAQQASTEQAKAPPPVFEMAPQAYIQLDWRSFSNFAVTPGSGRLAFDTFAVRRLRAGVEGQWHGLAFEVTVDPEDLGGTLLKDAYAEWRRGGYEIRVGQFKPPGSRDYGTAARQLDFLERSGLGLTLAAQRDLGGMLHGKLGRRFDYDLGLFAGDNNGSSRRAGLTGAARLEWEPSQKLVVAAYGSEGRLTSIDSDPTNGLEGRLPSGYRFFENLYVRGRRTRLGGDIEWSPGRWQFTVEALRVRDERKEQGVDLDDLPSVVGLGTTLTARWRFASRRDLAIRYDYLGFDDVAPETEMSSVRPRAADIRARAGEGVTFGASWGVARWARVMANAGVEWYSDPRSAPEPGRSGGYWTFGTRLQFELPRIFGVKVQ
jgi:Phosphate-selective porin O and P